MIYELLRFLGDSPLPSSPLKQNHPAIQLLLIIITLKASSSPQVASTKTAVVTVMTLIPLMTVMSVMTGKTVMTVMTVITMKTVTS